VVAHRTAPATRHLAERPPRDSVALRAIAAALVVLLAITLIALLLLLT